MKPLVFIHCYTTNHGLEILGDLAKQIAHVWSSIDYYDYQIVYEFPDKPNDRHLYEGVTLELLWKLCNEIPIPDDTPILYLHTKGASHPPESQPSQQAWRNELLRVLLGEKDWCLEQLAGADCVGAFLTDDTRYFFPGNFWWTTARHIRSLSNPIEWAKSSRAASILLDPSNIRYGYEDWITLSRPNITAVAKYRWRPDDPPGTRTLWDNTKEVIR